MANLHIQTLIVSHIVIAILKKAITQCIFIMKAYSEVPPKLPYLEQFSIDTVYYVCLSDRDNI